MRWNWVLWYPIKLASSGLIKSLLLLALAEFVGNQLSFLYYQRIPTILDGRVGLHLRSQGLDLLVDGGALRGILQLVLFLGRQCLLQFGVTTQSHPKEISRPPHQQQ